MLCGELTLFIFYFRRWSSTDAIRFIKKKRKKTGDGEYAVASRKYRRD